MRVHHSMLRSAMFRNVAALTLVLLAAESTYAQQATLTPSMDIWTTSVYSYAPGGGGPGGGLNNDQLTVGGWGDEYRALLQFDLSTAPKIAASAALRLYVIGAHGGTPVSMYLDRVASSWEWTTQIRTPQSPDSQRLWWANRPGFNQVSLLPAPVVGNYYDIDITSLYNQWQSGALKNFGVQLRPTRTNNSFNDFASSRNATAAWRPTLIVNGPLTVRPTAEHGGQNVASVGAGEKIAFTILKGWRDGRVKEPAVLILKAKDSYVMRLQETYGKYIIPRPTPEEVDFVTNQVVAVFWSDMPSTGYSISVLSVTGDNKKTVITVKTSVPKGMAGQMITYPFVALVIPRTESVKVIVTGDRNPPGKWWRDFSNTKTKELEVIVK